MPHPGACLPTYFLAAFCVNLGRQKGQGQTIMRFRRGRDLAAGLLIVVVGAGGFWLAADDLMGTAQRPGTGVLPCILSWCLIATRWALWLKARVDRGTGPSGWARDL